MLIFSKIYLARFIYDVLPVFGFPDDATRDIYWQNKIIKRLLYLLLPGTDSASFQFVFACELNYAISEENIRQMLFEIIFWSKNKDRLDLADDFYTLLGIQNKSLKKKVVLCEVESTDNPNMITIAVNPKEYFEESRNRGFNKKHNGIRKNVPGMNFDSYTRRILSLNDHETTQGNEHQKQIQRRLQVKNGKMNMTTV